MIRFLKDTTIWIGRAQRCGDGCCSWMEYDNEKALKGEEFDEEENHDYHLDFFNLLEGVDYERVFEGVSLSLYCKSINEVLNNPNKIGEKPDMFMHYRYRQLRKLFPHETFSVEQGEYNFFETTYNFLMGNEDINKITKSDYNNNYISWVKFHKQVKSS